ncbi:hypothetical protein DB35_08965 [Streptomyces abyssalis]|uniref:Uncharacterized protein n=1 Tax=Streptomyces abyssalis TaxID=933944 RepID=A0A1E7JRZ7_9ACTN|nr:hypothetical protein AN215_03850 [Streptomyces abyssalis]OEU94195.1 hypothetical protein DB35_08965 [Streptomyces abyssalis]
MTLPPAAGRRPPAAGRRSPVAGRWSPGSGPGPGAGGGPDALRQIVLAEGDVQGEGTYRPAEVRATKT